MIRNNLDIADFGADYIKVRDFLISIDDADFHFGRWDWMVTHGYLDSSYLSKIGVWEENGNIAALAVYDTQPGKTYIYTLPDYKHLLREMIEYAAVSLAKDDKFSVLVPDCAHSFQQVAADLGYIATENREQVAAFDIAKSSTDYCLPYGFRIVSLAEEYDACKLGEVMWKGFNHELDGEGAYMFNDSEKADIDAQCFRPNVSFNIKIAVFAPDGEYASFCGMWCDENSKTALVEPVATVPAYRRMGLGKAAVLEAIKRCGQLGAKRALVGSSQQFYYSIGFRPYQTSTFWRKQR